MMPAITQHRNLVQMGVIFARIKSDVRQSGLLVLILFLLLVFGSLTTVRAECGIYDTQAEANEELNQLRAECGALFDGGGTFHYSLVQMYDMNNCAKMAGEYEGIAPGHPDSVLIHK